MRILKFSLSKHCRFGLLALVAATTLTFLPTWSHATVDWTDGFEYANQTALEAVWSSSCPGNAGIISPSTDRFFSGAKSLKETFFGDGQGNATNTCFINRSLPASGVTLYSRFYMYMDNFTVDAVSTKMTSHGSQCCYPSFYWTMAFGQPVLNVQVVGIILDNGSLDSGSVYGSTIPQNQWVCIETRITMSDPGVDNGIIQAWINGAQVMNVSNQRMRSATVNQNNHPDTLFDTVQLYTQHGIGKIYYDDYAVSRDARIGCGSVPTSDITPPAPPSGLLIR